MKKRNKRDVEKVYSKADFIKKIRRLADALEGDKKFSIQIANERINVPKNAVISIEHEKGENEEEIEFQVKWKIKEK